MSEVVKYPALDLARLRLISVVSSLNSSLSLAMCFNVLLCHAPIVVFVCDGTYVTSSVPSCSLASDFQSPAPTPNAIHSPKHRPMPGRPLCAQRGASSRVKLLPRQSEPESVPICTHLCFSHDHLLYRCWAHSSHMMLGRHISWRVHSGQRNA